MSQFCAKCGAPWSPGLCGICATKELVRERDEARAEVERLRGDRAEVSSAKLSAAFTEGTLAAGDAMRDKLRTVAERQREACAAYLRNRMKEAKEDHLSFDYVRGLWAAVVYADATPLVTEGEP